MTPQTVNLKCPHCQTRIRIQIREQSYQARCPKCGGAMTIPAAKDADAIWTQSGGSQEPQQPQQTYHQAPPVEEHFTPKAEADPFSAFDIDTNPIRSNGKVWRGMKIPEGFVDNMIALFDFKIEYFVTPFILRVIWAVAVATTLFWLVAYLSIFVVDLMPDVSSDNLPRTRAELREMPWWVKGATLQVFKVVAYVTVAIGLLVSLLTVRIVVEAVAVVFRIASDLTSIRHTLESRPLDPSVR